MMDLLLYFVGVGRVLLEKFRHFAILVVKRRVGQSASPVKFVVLQQISKLRLLQNEQLFELLGVFS